MPKSRMRPSSLGSLLPSVDMSGPESMPDIIEFICSDRYLNRGHLLYPRQATLLKVIFLAHELLTEYDLEVLGGWADGFRLPEPGEIKAPGDDDAGSWYRYQPADSLAAGIQPDWERRMAMCVDEGRPWFREAEIIVGRRGSKGHIGGLCGARVLYHYHQKGDPQGFYGIDRDKKLQATVFAGKKEQAKVNQWRDLVNRHLGGTVFHPVHLHLAGGEPDGFRSL